MLYRVNHETKTITPIIEKDLASQGFLETQHLEEWFSSSGEILGRSLVWIARQDYASTDDRSDIIAIDRDSELLVVELKRGYVDIPAFTQAFNYASQYASMNTERVLQLFVDNSTKDTSTPLRKKASTIDEAAKILSELSGSTDVNENQVIILVGTGFDPRVLSMCEYLNKAVGSDGTVRAECWKISLFNEANSHFLQMVQILPVPDLQSQIEQAKEERRASKYKRDSNRIEFMWSFKEVAKHHNLTIIAKPGASYLCGIAVDGQPKINFEIYTTPTIYVPKASGYEVSHLRCDKYSETDRSHVYKIDNFDWSNKDTHRDAIEELVRVIYNTIPRPNTMPEENVIDQSKA